MDLLSKTFAPLTQEPATLQHLSAGTAANSSPNAKPVQPDGTERPLAATGQLELYHQAANALTAILAHAEAIRRFAGDLTEQHEEVAFSSVHIAAEAWRAWASIAALSQLEPRHSPAQFQGL